MKPTTRLYAVEVLAPGGDWLTTRYVEASTPSAARNHVANKMLKVRRPGVQEMIKLVRDKASIEVAGPETDPLTAPLPL